MLGTHPRILPGGEVSRLTKSIALNAKCSCGETVRTCDFWRSVVDELSVVVGVNLWNNPYSLDLGLIKAASEIDYDRQTRQYLMKRAIYLRWLELLHVIGIDPTRSPLAHRYRGWIAHNALVHDILRSRSGRQIVADSGKGFRIAAGFYQNRPDRTRIILLARDGRGVVSSYLRSGTNLRESVRLWVAYYERALSWIERYIEPEHILRVRYEDLVLHSDVELAKIFKFLELSPIGGFSDIKPSADHILEGNRNTLRSKSVQLDERWRSELSGEQLRYFMKEGGDLMRRFGYIEGNLLQSDVDDKFRGGHS